MSNCSPSPGPNTPQVWAVALQPHPYLSSLLQVTELGDRGTPQATLSSPGEGQWTYLWCLSSPAEVADDNGDLFSCRLLGPWPRRILLDRTTNTRCLLAIMSNVMWTCTISKVNELNFNQLNKILLELQL